MNAAALLAALALLAASTITFAQTNAAPNILVIIADDMGVETLGKFGLGTDPATTPTLDALADQGMIFTNTWAQAMCSPTRATILSGRYGFRTGVGSPTGRDHVAGPLPDPPDIPPNLLELSPRVGAVPGAGFPGASWGLRSDEVTLPQALGTRINVNYDRAAFGKWHLADSRNGWENHPNLAGFDHYSGLLTCCTQSYFSWQHLENGSFSDRSGYGPSDKVNDAIAWLGSVSSRTDPWFLWLAFNTPHTPIHLPPADLRSSQYADIESADDMVPDQRRVFHAMLEAMDTEIGRLLNQLGPDALENTYVIFIGDNGTDNRVVAPPFDPGRAKSSLYNGGIHVPLLIAGPGIPAGSVSSALTNSADLYATILEVAGVELTDVVPDDVHVDSVSLVPYFSDPQRESIREWIYADSFVTDNGVTSGSYTMRNQQYKLLVNQGNEEFYDLQSDPYEHADLLRGELDAQEAAALRALRAQLAELHDSAQ